MTVQEFVEAAPGVVVTTAEKYVTTSTIVISGPGAVLIDPAWTGPELDGIAAWLHDRTVEVTAGVSTHAHHDHLLWNPAFGDAPRWASPTSVVFAHRWHAELLEQLGPDLPPDWPDPLLGIQALAGERVPDPFGAGPDEEMRFVVHDGHAPGHTAVWLPDRGVLVAGDMLSDIELPLPFSPDDLGAYLAALDTLAPVVSAVTMLIPGHGHVTDRPMERLDADRRYLDDVLHGREAADARRANAGMDAAHRRIVALARDLPR